MAPLDLGSDPSPDPGPGTDGTKLSRLDLSAVVTELAARVDRMERTLEQLASQRMISGQPAIDEAIPQRISPPAIEGVPPPPPLPLPALPDAWPVITIHEVPRTSLEDRLGSQIFNRVAIVAILIGAALGLKLAIDNHLIGPLGRVLIGLIGGSGLVLWSERFRRREFAAFSYSLKAIGSGILYLSLWAAFQLYHLLPAQAAFSLMLLVTLWNAWMAWSQVSELLAAYAISGAFATPLLLSNGGNHQVFLFSYLLSIDLATIALVRLGGAKSRAWARLLIAALPATAAYFVGWFTNFYSADHLASTSLFVALFFFAFLTVPFSSGAIVAEPGDYLAQQVTDVLLPLGNAVFGSLAMYSVLEDSNNHEALPWVSLLFAAIYLAAMRLPQRTAARAVHLSLAVLFLTITIPLKARGRWITIGWLAEGLSLLWISSRLSVSEGTGDTTHTSIPRMLRRLASVALLLGFFGLLVLPFWLDRWTETAFFNQRFATELAGIFALAGAAWIANHAQAATHEPFEESAALSAFSSWMQLAAASTIAVNLVALLAGVREIDTYWQPGFSYPASAESALQTALSISAFIMLYGAGLLAMGFWKRSAFLRWQGLVLLVIAIAKTFLYDVRSLSQGYRVVSFLGLGVLLLGVSFFYVRQTGATSSKP